MMIMIDDDPSAFVLMGALSLPDAQWKYNTAERMKSRRFLECVEKNFLM